MNEIKFKSWTTFIISQSITVFSAIVAVLSAVSIAVPEGLLGNVKEIGDIVCGSVIFVASIIFNFMEGGLTAESLKTKVTDIITSVSGAAIGICGILSFTALGDKITSIRDVITVILGILACSASNLFDAFKKVQEETA